MLLDTYYKEKALYERRLQLLDILDDFAREAFYQEDFTMDKEDYRLVTLRKEFADVLNPVDVEIALKKIYPDRLYAPPEEKK